MINKYAKIENNIVDNIIVVNDSVVSELNGLFIKVTDSTNNAEIGYEYNLEKNKFIAFKPFESWTLNADTLLWEAPVAKPEEEGFYRWDEETQSWISV